MRDDFLDDCAGDPWLSDLSGDELVEACKHRKGYDDATIGDSVRLARLLAAELVREVAGAPRHQRSSVDDDGEQDADAEGGATASEGWAAGDDEFADDTVFDDEPEEFAVDDVLEGMEEFFDEAGEEEL